MLRWFSPINEEEITDISLHYVFEAAPGAVSYTVYAAHTPDFSDSVTTVFSQKPDCIHAYYLPKDEELLPAGEWYLKAVSDNGIETEVLHFEINDLHSKAPLKTVISREHPLISIFDYSKHRVGAEYDILPEDLKPYAAISGGPGWGASPDVIYDKTMAFDDLGYPYITHFFSHGEVINNRYIVTPLAIAEKILKNANNMKAVVGLEIYMGVRPDEDWVNTIYRRVIMLCGKYGYPFLHTDGNRNDIDLPSVIRRPIFTEVLREYSDYVIFSYKQNHANASYSCYGAILGAWMGGLAKHIGIQAENWYWNDAGFCDDIGGYHGYLQGNEQQIPAVFTAQMLIPGISMGAEYYSLEGEGWMLQMRGQDKYEYSPQGIAVLSLLRTVIRRQLIPSKKEVLSQIHACVDAEGWGFDWGDAWQGGIFRNTFRNLYQIVHTKELFPKQLRYFYLPFVTDHKEDFSHLLTLHADQIIDPDQVNEALNPLYENWFTGNAYVTRTGGTYCIMNSNENTDQSQYFKTEINSKDTGISPVSSIEGSLGLWQYLIAEAKDGQLHLHLNARKGSELRLYLTSAVEKNLELLAADGFLSFKKDIASGAWELLLQGNDEPVECIIAGEGAQPSYALMPPLKNRPFTEEFLSDKSPSAVSGSEKGIPTVDYMANTRYGKLPLAMNAVRYPHGISIPREGSISYALGGKYTSLTMTVGFDIDVWMPIIVNHTDIVWDRYEKEIAIVLKVMGDGKLLYESPKLCSTFYREPLTLDVSGIQTITFTVDGEIHQKPLWCAITGTADRYLFDTSSMPELPPAEVYLDLGNPILS